MPWRPRAACPVCRRTTACSCRARARQDYDREHGSSHARYGPGWPTKRARHLELEPSCRIHRARGVIVAGEVIDHILPRVLLVADGHPDPDGDWNLQTLCRECDRSKSLRLDGGLGNRLVPLAERPTDQLAAAERARAGAELPAGAPA